MSPWPRCRPPGDPAVAVRRRRHLPRGRPRLPPGAARPVFEDDVVGLHRRDRPARPDERWPARRFDFAAIGDPRWRLVAKELIVALLAPRHEAVAPLPRAYRTPAHLADRQAAAR